MNSKKLKIMLFDAGLLTAALFLSFLIRFDFKIPEEFLTLFIEWLTWFILIQNTTFYLCGLYSRISKYTSLFDLYAILSTVFISSALSILYVYLVFGLTGFPRSILLIWYILNSIFAVGLRLGVRVYFTHYQQKIFFESHKGKIVLLLIGAGKTGEKISKEIMSTSNHNYFITGFVDDDINKHRSLIHGKEIFGNINSLLSTNIKYDELLITAPTASENQIRRIVEICKKTGKKFKIVPGIHEIINSEITFDTIREVAYSDLLGRKEIQLDIDSIKNTIRGKRVLITGAGGSIGAELVKQSLIFNPSEIVCLDISEENIYNLDQYFLKTQTKTIVKTVLASVNIKNECEKVFSENLPNIVLHAAAYKHVPIQELHPWTAVNTNLLGTLNIVELSDKYLVEKFVLVSTDKAVNPVNVMGATKRAAEKLIQSYNSISKTTFIAVRFGNVLGSSGSAIPTFQKQINQGGPITITHPEMTRYFMSIQEATQLILQCVTIGKDGEIFLLEMGKPISILQMAKDLIRLSGLEPEIDIPIVYTGLRPGEKLYEELQLSNEQKVTTTHNKIMILKDKISHIPWSIFKIELEKLFDITLSLDNERIQRSLRKMIPTYTYKNINSFVQLEKNIDKDFKAKA
jgi:FlaA1/EpsC-like NDP-sugar epimerase